MTSSFEEQSNPNPISEDPIEKISNGDDIDDEDMEEAELEVIPGEMKLQSFIGRLCTEDINLRLHKLIIKGTSKTKTSVIEYETRYLKDATTMRQLLLGAHDINERLRSLEIFDAVDILFEAGPPELPDTANITVEIFEAKNPPTVTIGVFTKPDTRSLCLEGAVKLKNLFGYGDKWDALGVYGLDPCSEISAGVSLPRFPSSARISLLTQDWMKTSSYKDKLLGFSLGLYSSKHHNLSYNIAWRSLTDPSETSSASVSRELGQNLISSINYKFIVDTRDSSLRPTNGYAFVSTTQIAGLMPDNRSLQFARQVFDLRIALPLGFYNAALNLGLSTGAIFPLGNGFMNKSSPLSERFFLGGSSSPVCTLGGPTLFGFNHRGLGPTEPRRSSNGERDFVGGDLALTAFADLSFNLPLKVLTDIGIHGHVFASSGSLTKLTQNAFRNFSFRKFGESLRSSVGGGIVIPTKLFRMEINYCYVMKKLEYDSGKTGIQLNFSTPW
ncbi:hypothetical protein ACHQM5_006740 [Ranunculus cassubicifolius]